VTPTTGMRLISVHTLDPFRKLRSFRKWNNGMDINPEDWSSYTTQYQEVFLKYVENEYCAKHRCILVNTLQRLLSSHPNSSAIASRCCQSSFDTYDLPSDDEEYLARNNLAETTPGRSDHAAYSLGAVRLDLNLRPKYQ